VIEKIHSFVFATKDVKILDLCLEVLEAWTNNNKFY
jgi:hypothetical protein